MPILSLSKTFQSDLRGKLEGSTSVKSITHVLNSIPTFISIKESIQKVLDEDKFVVIKGFPVGSKKDRLFFEALVSQFGQFYGAVEFTGIKVDCRYAACSRNALTLHNDDPIDLVKQPKLGVIQVIKQDPLFKVENGVVIIRELIRVLKFENKKLLDDLLSTPVPMLSYGVNYDDDNKDEIVINEPILRKTEVGYMVRFDFDRNKFYYQIKQEKQKYEESKMIYDFLFYADKIKKTMVLELGDILIHNNLEALHDRGECSIEFNEDGSLNSREILVSFVR